MKWIILILALNFNYQFVIDIAKRQIENYFISEHLESVKLIDENANLSIKEKIINFKNIQYYGNIYMGSNKETHTVILDSGSNILWLPAIDCHSCSNNTSKYDFYSSSSYKNLTSVANITYAQGFVEGFESEDLISLSSNKNNLDSVPFYFLLVEKEESLNALSDGVLGLGVNYENENQSIVLQLYKHKLIAKPKFTVMLNSEIEKSKIYFGELSAENSSIPVYQNKCSLPTNSPYWGCVIKSVSLNNNSDSQFKPKFGFSVFDTGTSYLIMPLEDLIDILSLFKQEKSDLSCALTLYNQLVCKCESPSEFSDFKLNFDSENQVEVPIRNLIYFNKNLSYQCVFEIIASDSENLSLWILGDSILRNLIVEFDMESKVISFNNKSITVKSYGIGFIILGIIYFVGLIIAAFLMGRMTYRIIFKEEI